MYKFVSKYATAAHLALLTVAPLFLFPFFGDFEIAKVLLWLSLICSIWVVMAPAPVGGERLHHARRRLVAEVVRDPLFWFSLLCVVISGFRALNGGIKVGYDYESASWLLSHPVVEIFPGCVDGAGFLPFAVCVALLVLLQGVRHALDRQSVVAFLVHTSVFAGLSAVVATLSISCDNQSALLFQKCEYLYPSFVGAAYGVFLVGGVAAFFYCVETRNFVSELLTVVSTAATTLGLVMFSPAYTLSVFAIAFVAIVAVSWSFHGRYISGSGNLRCFLMTLLVIFSAIAPFLLCEEGSFLANRRDAILSLQMLPSGFGATRAALSGIALKVWLSGPWLGSGLGSFNFDIRFLATPADWAVISPFQKAASNGWWQLLAERGVVGALMFATTLGLLMWSYLAGMFRSVALRRIRGVHFVTLVSLLAIIAVCFVDCSFLRADVMLAVGAALSVSAAASPLSRQGDSKIEEIK